MSQFPLYDPDDDGYIVHLNKYEHGPVKNNFQMALEDQETMHSETAKHALEWYGLLWSAHSFSQLSFGDHNLGVRPPSYNAHPSSIPFHFSSPRGQTVDPHLPTAIAPNLTLCILPLTAAPNSTILPVRCHYNLEGHPSIPEDLVTRLKGATAESLAYLTMDIVNFLWTHMSTNSLGQMPMNILCETLYIKAVQRCQMVQSNWVPEHSKSFKNFIDF